MRPEYSDRNSALADAGRLEFFFFFNLDDRERW